MSSSAPIAPRATAQPRCSWYRLSRPWSACPFASVPLYRLFCQATGLGGTTAARGDAAPAANAAAVVTVRFDAETAPDLGWEFRPAAERGHRSSRRGAADLLSRRQQDDRTDDRLRHLQRHPGQGRHLFRQAAVLLLYRAASGSGRERRHGRGLLCRSRHPDRSEHQRRAHDHAVLYDVPGASAGASNGFRRRRRHPP